MENRTELCAYDGAATQSSGRPYTLAGFGLTTHDSAGGGDTTGPRRQGNGPIVAVGVVPSSDVRFS
jgi:hypothetical protein